MRAVTIIGSLFLASTMLLLLCLFSSLIHAIPSVIPRITLNTLTLNVKSDKVYTRHGVPISVTGIAQVCSNNCVAEMPLSFYKIALKISAHWDKMNLS